MSRTLGYSTDQDVVAGRAASSQKIETFEGLDQLGAPKQPCSKIVHQVEPVRYSAWTLDIAVSVPTISIWASPRNGRRMTQDGLELQNRQRGVAGLSQSTRCQPGGGPSSSTPYFWLSSIMFSSFGETGPLPQLARSATRKAPARSRSLLSTREVAY